MQKIHIFLAIMMASVTGLTPAKAQEPPRFRLPIDCMPGKNCWVMNYVDMIPEDGQGIDFKCLNRTYDGHKGTDIAIRDEAVMKKGVSVLAAMDGIVERVRDGEADRWPTEEDMEAVKKSRKECGNAALIDHGNGLKTLYCHMKQSSIPVKTGDKVKAGDKIGEVGLSGYTRFPHLHFGILWEGAVVDPFTGLNDSESCGGFKHSLWDESVGLDYEPAVIYDAGFDNIVPDLDKIERGERGPDSITAGANLLAFWMVYFGARENDTIYLEIRGPGGTVFARDKILQPKTRARQFYYVGRRLTDQTLPAGKYTGRVTVTRDDMKDQSWTLERRIEVKG